VPTNIWSSLGLGVPLYPATYIYLDPAMGFKCS